MKHDMCAQSEYRVINNKKGHMKASIASKEDEIKFASALTSDHGERKRYRKVSKHRNEHKSQRTMPYENEEEHENYFVSHDQLRDSLDEPNYFFNLSNPATWVAHPDAIEKVITSECNNFIETKRDRSY